VEPRPAFLDSLMGLVRGDQRLFDRAAWAYFIGYYRSRWIALASYAVAASLQSLLVLPVLVLIRYAFDTAIPQGQITQLFLIGAGILFIRLVGSLIGLYLRAVVLRMVKGAVCEMRQDLLAKLYALARDFYGTVDTDRIHSRIVQDTERVDNTANTLLSTIVPGILTGSALVVVLFFLNWRLVLAMIAVLPLLWLSTTITSRFVKKNVYEFQRAFETFSKGVLFVLRHMDLTRIQAFEAEERARQKEHLERLRITGERMAMSYARHAQVQANVTGFAGIAILVVGGIAVAGKIMTIGEFLAFYVAAGMLNAYVNGVIGGFPDLITGNASLVTLRGLIDAGPLVPYRGTRRISFAGGISLRNVVFGYGEHVVLRDFSLEIGKGSKIAIVGANGAGKSTILNLIIGFNRPASGAVLADGAAYDDLDLQHLRRSIGVVMQHPTFFSGTILDNITYGRPKASREEVRRAAHLAFADDFIMALPAGYDTEIGEGGVLLSGGECQRLAIARALVGRPNLLILDEPTNHIDVETVERLMHVLTSDLRDTTIIVISHGASVVQFADAVYQVADGMLAPLRFRPVLASGASVEHGVSG
jgi:ATP-binding cassette, subfamily B, bacterial